MPATVITLLLGAALALAACGGGGRDADRARGAAPAADAAALRSRPDLRPPPVAVDRRPARPGGRLIFVSPRLENVPRDGKAQQQGALALDEQGRTRWFQPVADGEPVTDVRVQRYRGQRVLTWWQGAASKFGIGRGEAVIVDETYRIVKTVQAGNGHTLDLHEFLLTDRGTALVTIYSRARRDLSAIGGLRDAQVTEGIVQEIDVATGRVLFEWHSLDHVDPAESVQKLPTKPKDSYDYFHINSIVEDGDGHLLVSARNTSAVYRIDRETGEVDWRLGGKKSDFEMGAGTGFGLQHDARPLPGGLVQIFDNVGGDDDDETTPSSVKVLRLDRERMRATLERAYRQPDAMRAESQGNGQPLDDGGLMVGWGSTGAFSQFDAQGRLRFDAHLPAEYDTYRAYMADWVGRPAIPPAIRAGRDSGQVTIDVSWNGATEVRGWQVLAGPSSDDLRELGGPADWSGLEQTLVRMTDEPYVAVAALDAAGRVLGTSAAVKLPPAPAPAD